MTTVPRLFAPLIASLALMSLELNAQDSLAADSSRLDSLLRAHRYPLAVRNGVVEGPGAAFLLRETERAQCVMIGEFHNGSDIPRFVSSLFHQLRRTHGFNYLALENDPVIMGLMSSYASAGRADSAYATARRYLHALQFWNDQELEMMLEVGKEGGRVPNRLWGLDQAWGALHVLHQLAAMAPDAAARRAVDSLTAIVAPLESTRPLSVAQSAKRFISDADSAVFRNLRAAYRPRPGSRADSLLKGLELSNRIYLGNGARRNGLSLSYAANDTREQNMKALFMRNYRQAQAAGDRLPRVMARFGHVHATRGFNDGDLQTLGNFLSEFSRANDMTSFHLTVYQVNEPGTYWTLMDFPNYVPLGRVGSTREWYIVDLRPLRVYARSNRLRTLNPELRRVIFGFDAALLIGGGTRGTYERLKD